MRGQVQSSNFQTLWAGISLEYQQNNKILACIDIRSAPWYTVIKGYYICYIFISGFVFINPSLIYRHGSGCYLSNRWGLTSPVRTALQPGSPRLLGWETLVQMVVFHWFLSVTKVALEDQTVKQVPSELPWIQGRWAYWRPPLSLPSLLIWG